MAATATVRVKRGRVRQSSAGYVDPRERYFNRFCFSVIIVFAAVWLLPIIWAAVTSFKPEGEIATNPTSWWSDNWTLDAYRSVWNAGDIQVWYVNSALTATFSALLCVGLCSMAGFAVARIRYLGKRIVMILLLSGLMIPSQAMILPLFQEFKTAGLLNTYWAIILAALPAPIAVFVFSSFFSGLPNELSEGARVDGAGWFRVYWQVYMPLCRPAASAVAIFTFVWTWNAFLWPLLVMTNPDMMTIPVGLATVQSSFGIRYAQIMASAVLGALPLVMVFLFFQRRIVEGIANTGIK